MLNMMLLNATPAKLPAVTAPSDATANPGAGKFGHSNDTTPSFANQLHAQLQPAQTSSNDFFEVPKKGGNQHTPQEVLNAELVSIQPDLTDADAAEALALLNTALVSEHSHQEARSGAMAQPTMLQRIADSQQLASSMQGSSLQESALQNTSVRTGLQQQESASLPLTNAARMAAADQQGNLSASPLASEMKAAMNMPQQANGAISLSENQLNALRQAAQNSQQLRASMPPNAMQAFQHRAQLQQQAINPQAPLAAAVPVKQAMLDTPVTGFQQSLTEATMNSLQTAASSQSIQGNPATGQVANPLVSAPLASAGWQQQVGQQVVNMHLRQDNQVALRLHPAELGPLMVNLKMDEQAASLQFTSANPQVRAALEAALPQLRELLAEQGIQLSDSAVNDGRADQGMGQENQQQSSDSNALADNSLIAGENDKQKAGEQRLDIQLNDGQIDLYA